MKPSSQSQLYPLIPPPPSRQTYHIGLNEYISVLTHLVRPQSHSLHKSSCPWSQLKLPLHNSATTHTSTKSARILRIRNPLPPFFSLSQPPLLIMTMVVKNTPIIARPRVLASRQRAVKSRIAGIRPLSWVQTLFLMVLLPLVLIAPALFSAALLTVVGVLTALLVAHCVRA